MKKLIAFAACGALLLAGIANAAGTPAKVDSAAVAKKQADEKAEQEKFQKTFAKVGELYQQQKYKECVEEIDKALAESPRYEDKIGIAKFDLMTKYDEAAAYTYARKVADSFYKDNAKALNSVAYLLVSNKALKTPDYDLALALAKRANDLTKGKNAPVLDTLAMANFQKGNTDKAIECERKALNIAAKDNMFPPSNKAAMSKRLEDYRNKKNGK